MSNSIEMVEVMFGIVKAGGCVVPLSTLLVASQVETLLKKRDVAAFIMEPIICNLGAVVPKDEFVRGVRKLCTRYGTLFIADEVATGFGRTGRLFACEHFDLAILDMRMP